MTDTPTSGHDPALPDDPADESTYTRDTALAAVQALRLLARKAEDNVDDGTQEALYSLRIAVTLLGTRDVDQCDCEALAWLLNRAEALLEQEHRFNSEARRRLHIGTGGYRA